MTTAPQAPVPPGLLRRAPASRLAAGAVLLLLVLYPVVFPWDPYPQGVALLGFLLGDPGDRVEHHLGVRGLHLPGAQPVPRARFVHRRDRRAAHRAQPAARRAARRGHGRGRGRARRGGGAPHTGPRVRHHHHRDAARRADPGDELLRADEGLGRHHAASCRSGARTTRTSPSTTRSCCCSWPRCCSARGSGARSSVPASSRSVRTRARRPRSASTPPGSRSSPTLRAPSSSAWPAGSTRTSSPSSTRWAPSRSSAAS